MFNNRPLILASQSPRRSQLLREAGFEFTVQSTEIDESFPDTMPVEDVAPWLAQRKAQAARHLIVDNEIILAADSVVIHDGKIYNKPADYSRGISNDPNPFRATTHSDHRCLPAGQRKGTSDVRGIASLVCRPE